MLSQFLLFSFLVSSLYAFPLSGKEVPRSESSPSNATAATGASDFIAATWFAGYHANKGFPVSNISWEKYTHVHYSFALTTPDLNLSLTPEDEKIIPEFVKAAHDNNVSTSMSLGGWTGSQYFSTAVGTAENRTAFVKAISYLVEKYSFDGVDFDWEYPGKQSIGCNTNSSSDTTNFLLLLQELRSTPCTSHLILSAATAITPFVDASGSPSTNVSAIARELNFIAIMNYDIWGSWSTGVGPNAPLNDSCASTANQQGSAVSAVKAWSNAGFPVNKIVLAVASYGHSFSVNKTDALYNGQLVAYPPFTAQNQPTGDAWDDPAGPDICGVNQPAGGHYDFWGLIKAGYLTTDGKPAPGIDYRFDDCSQTAYVYNATSQVQISYDDTRAFTAKGEYIASAGLRGFSMWETGGDYNDLLLDAIRKGADVEDLEYCD